MLSPTGGSPGMLAGRVGPGKVFDQVVMSLEWAASAIDCGCAQGWWPQGAEG
jgi:hypothetical protein